MAADDTVAVKITADNSDINQSFSKATDTIKSFGSVAADVLGNVKELAEGFLEIELLKKFIEGIIDLEKEFANLAEEVQRVAQMTGLSTQAVQEFNYAVELTGGSAESAATTIERLEKNMLSAGNSTSEAALTFKSLGISVKDAEGNLRPVQDVLGDLADKFSGANDGATKTAIAITLLGRGGAQLIPVLNQGRDGLAGLNAQLAATGSIMSGEQIKSFDELKESLTTLNKAWEGVKLAVATYFEPAAQAIVTWLTNVIEKVTSLLNGLNQLPTALQKIGIGTGTTDSSGEGGGGKTNLKTPQTAQEVKAAQNTAAAKLQILKDTDNAQFAAFTSFTNQKLALENEANTHQLAMGKESNQQYLQNQQLFLTEAYQRENDSYTALLSSVSAFYNSKKALYAGDAAEQAKIDEEETKFQEQTQQKQAQAQQTYALNSKKLQDATIQDAQQQYTNLAKSINGSLEDSVAGVIDGTKSMKDAFKDFASSVTQDLAKVLSHNLLDSLFGDTGGAGGAGGVGGLISGLFSSESANGNVFSGGKLTAFADGGIVNGASMFPTAGGMGLMGEAGPEAIIPLSRGKDGTLGVAGGGNHITMNISTPDPNSFRQNTGQMMAQMNLALRRSQRNL